MLLKYLTCVLRLSFLAMKCATSVARLKNLYRHILKLVINIRYQNSISVVFYKENVDTKYILVVLIFSLKMSNFCYCSCCFPKQKSTQLEVFRKGVLPKMHKLGSQKSLGVISSLDVQSSPKNATATAQSVLLIV